MIARALVRLEQDSLVAKKIVERSRTYNGALATANAATGVIAINRHRLTARHKRDPDLVASIIVHENHHLRQGPVKNWYENRIRIEEEAYRIQVNYLETIGNHKLARHVRTVGRANIMDDARIIYV